MGKKVGLQTGKRSHCYKELTKTRSEPVGADGEGKEEEYGGCTSYGHMKIEQ